MRNPIRRALSLTSGWWSLLLVQKFGPAAAAFAAAARAVGKASPIPPPPSLSVPVWSLAAPLENANNNNNNKNDDDTSSMNIVTFASPVSVKPRKLWIVSLYHGTRTKDAFVKARGGTLQLLRPDQKVLVPCLGKRSGNEPGYCKSAECAQRGFPWYHAAPTAESSSSAAPLLRTDLLPRCAAYLHLSYLSTLEAEDHLAVLCEVVGTSVWDDTQECIVNLSESSEAGTPPQALDHREVLYTGLLRAEGII